ncbi:GNAT family N-acetyltransferase [Paenibacillus sp. NPDC058910]|uniref:GNAT family N-acetyltransferase n=1 Tax=unclassified Paenibacillus TaxID=185978 RepID=UPI0036972D75
MNTPMETNPILLSFPDRFETERLIIRAPEWGDGERINEAILESVEELKPWLPFARNIPAVSESEAYVRKARLQFMERSDLVMHLLDKDSLQLVGSSGLHRMNWEARTFEIGYWLRSSRTGQGLMKEAVDGITDFAIQHLGANRIEIRCDTLNERSIKVAERCGFTLEGTLRNVMPRDRGGFSHLKVYSKVRGVEF